MDKVWLSFHRDVVKRGIFKDEKNYSMFVCFCKGSPREKIWWCEKEGRIAGDMPWVGKEFCGVEWEEELGLRITDSSPVTGGKAGVWTGAGAPGGSMRWGDCGSSLLIATFFFFFPRDMESKIMSQEWGWRRCRRWKFEERRVWINRLGEREGRGTRWQDYQTAILVSGHGFKMRAATWVCFSPAVLSCTDAGTE